jgi:hypothetical protein
MRYTYRPAMTGRRLLVLAGLCIATVMPMNSHAESVALRTGFPESAGVVMKTHNFTVENLQKAHEMGFRVVRRAFHWNAIEKEKGVYDFSQWDPQMAEAKRLGITIVGCWFGNNKLHEDDGRGGIQTEEGRRAFAAFAAASAERYRDHNVLWEVWNEPNVRTFWRKDGQANSEEFAQEYTDLVKAIMTAVLAVDPDAFVMVGAVSNYWKPSYEWTEWCFRMGILDTGVRAWSVHPYGVKTPEEFAIGHRITRELLGKYGHLDMPMLNTERGFAIQELKNNEGWSGGNLDQVMNYQAWHFVRQYMADQMNNVPITVWYEWDGKDAWTGSAFALFNEEPRPIATAAAVLFEQLDGYRYVSRIDTGYSLDYIALYRNEAGEQKLVAWTAPQPGSPPEQAFPHQVAIHVGTSAALNAIGVLGEAVEVTRGDGGEHRLHVSGAPQYVTVPKDAAINARSVEPYIAPPTPGEAPPANAIDLRLFEAEDRWTFSRNTGNGLFEIVPSETKSFGVLHYDFTQSQTQSRPLVQASTNIEIAESASAVLIYVRSPLRQQLTFRLIDSTAQTHQFKQRIEGNGLWERVEIPLTRRLEHWGGANDGNIHYPIKSLIFAVPLPSEDNQRGKVEYADVMVVPQ